MSNKITSKKILVLRYFTVEPLLNELEDKFLNRDIKCKFDISTYNSAITEVLKIKKTKIDREITIRNLNSQLRKIKNDLLNIEKGEKILTEIIV